MPSTSRPNSKRDDSSASSIQMELEQLLSTSQSEVFGTEALKDNTSRKGKSKKITYTKRTDDSKDSNDDDKSKKSARSRRSRISRASGRPKKSTDESNKSESRERRSLERRNSKRSPKPSLERKNSKRSSSKSPRPEHKSLERKDSKRSKSPKPDRPAKDSRKIKYRSKEPETPEERDRDARSYRSKESKGSRGLRRSSHRKLKDDGDGLASSKRGSYRSRGKSPDSTEDNDGKPTSSRTNSRRTSSFRSKASRRKSWSFDDFDNNEWSSSDDEGDVEVDLNDGVEGEFRLKDAGNEKNRSRSASGERKPRPRRHNSRESTSLERIKPPQSNIPRSSSLGKLSGRRHSRKGSGSAMDVGMILGDPSRRAPPTRSKSNDMFANSRFQTMGGDRKSLTRRNSGNFAEYLRKQGLGQKSDRSTARTHYSDPSSVSQDSQDDNDNPFEVTYHHSFSQNDNWDPFGSDNAAEENTVDTNERRGNLRPTRSGGLLQTSSKDTISRLPVGANVRKDSSTKNMGAMARASMETNELGDRDKQRRADYQKSIAAAAMAGRRLSSRGVKPTRRQTRTVRSSFDESVRQLEGALQSAQ